MDPLASFLLSITSGLLIAIVIAIVTVRLSLQRFRSERWWERKFEVYSTIIESLFHIQNYLAEESVSEMEIRELHKEKRDELRGHYSESLDSITKAGAIGAFIISNEAAICLSDCLRSLGSSYQRALSVTDALQLDLATVKDCSTKMQAYAQKDLGVK